MAGNLSRFTVTLIVLGLITALTLALGILFWHKQSVATHALQVKTEQMNQQSEDIQKRLDTLERTCNDSLAEIETSLKGLDKGLVNFKYLPTFLTEIQQRAGESGNKIKTIQPSDTKQLDINASPLMELPPELQVKLPGEVINVAPPSTTTASAAPPAGGTPAGAQPNAQGGAPPASKPPPYYTQQINMDLVGSYSSLLSLLTDLSNFGKLLYVKSINISPEGQNGELRFHLETYAIIPPDQYKATQDLSASGVPPIPAGTSQPQAGPATPPAPGPTTTTQRTLVPPTGSSPPVPAGKPNGTGTVNAHPQPPAASQTVAPSGASQTPGPAGAHPSPPATPSQSPSLPIPAHPPIPGGRTRP